MKEVGVIKGLGHVVVFFLTTRVSERLRCMICAPYHTNLIL